MDTRVSLQTTVQQAVANSTSLSDQLAKIQAQAATGKQYPNVSDDPSASLAVLADNNQATTYGIQLANVNTATATLNNSVSTLQAVSDAFLPRNHAIDRVQASNSTNDSTASATDVDFP